MDQAEALQLPSWHQLMGASENNIIKIEQVTAFISTNTILPFQVPNMH